MTEKIGSLTSGTYRAARWDYRWYVQDLLSSQTWSSSCRTRLGARRAVRRAIKWLEDGNG